MTSKPVGVLSYQCDIFATLSYAETTWKELTCTTLQSCLSFLGDLNPLCIQHYGMC